MSLINKMLQDLDARGTPGGESTPSQIRPVVHQRPGIGDRVGQRAIALAVGGACVAVALAWFGWSQYRHARSAARPAVASVVAAPARSAPAAVTPAQGMSSTITIGPAPRDPASSPQPKTVAGFEPDSGEARAARQAIMSELQARVTAGVPRHVPEHVTEHVSKIKAKQEKRPARKAAALAAHADRAAVDAVAAAAPKDKRAVQGRQESGAQRAEGEYRSALASLQDGRMTETLASLEQALRLDPGHEAARQTLVGLLIEAKRPEEAIRHLQAALALDARQPALAMLLARLQIERGGSGIETLTRTLPYAGNNADYHAFLAGALQREQRHREAAEQYQAALRGVPGNGVWWMGLAMSLQAEKRNGEALEAFQRARASGMLSAELQAFVERRLQQLGR
jgi:MSHA biogenesis protein MshN